MASSTDITITGPSGNAYRFAGDYLHDAALTLLVCHACCCGQSVAGLSARTQWMYLTLYVSRYLDLLDHQQAPYLVVHKLGYIGATVMALLCFHFFSKTYQKDADTCPAWAIALLMLMVAFCLTADSTVIEILWTWSQLLEGFAMVPQYVCSYRNAKAGLADSCGVSAWICLMGAYKFCYMLNWMHKKSRIQWYWDPNSWLCGIVNCSFFVDYVLFRLVNVSCLRRLTLACDDGLHVVGEELQNRLGGCLLSPGQRASK
ncbi:unnamed protein product [Effrenium voratum]|uniref:Uncharacterized protein n=1 Tax=Effrenium voratum TaxID=2562239 RepID=A0AA36HZ02_9DINO|nr:unnamed protein product [Effrenium voratum]